MSCSEDSNLKVWDPATGLCLWTLRGHSGEDGCICKYSYTALARRDAEVKKGCPVKGHSKPVECMAISGNVAISFSYFEQAAQLWDISTGQPLRSQPFRIDRQSGASSDRIEWIAFNKILATCSGSSVDLWRVGADAVPAPSPLLSVPASVPAPKPKPPTHTLWPAASDL